MTQIQAYENMSKEALIEHHRHTLQQHADDMDMLSKELASRTTPTHKVGLGGATSALGPVVTIAMNAARLAEEAELTDKLSEAAPTTAQLWAMSCGYPVSPETFAQIARDVLEIYGKHKNAEKNEPVVASEIKTPLGEIRVGQLPTVNQDEYPGLGDWWVQLRIGPEFDEVLARVYGDSPQQAVERAQALTIAAAPTAPVGTSAACSCPSGNGSLRPWPCPVHPPETENQQVSNIDKEKTGLKLLKPDDLELLIACKRGALPPCPFCGSGPLMQSRVNNSPEIQNGPIYQSKIICSNTNCFASILSNDRSLEGARARAMEKWVNRTMISTQKEQQRLENLDAGEVHA